ncbi:hypothetical protein KFL_006810080 [Klebsormidium nitens]|uniref:C2H2-type domain-containing protein n=1 Tax=Klebsormidium nitens TaxID=105231 RepID=A0A1Y1IKU2_KLENI|nr:hypothetical protein KFL_006810080 [Klebsormidium nitens]|eukprot:GAQ90762.1 hypothetical protein KFL_006810080 [Klebsormidium nitens]
MMGTDGPLNFASLADLDNFQAVVKTKHFRDDASFPLKKRFRQRGPFRWFKVWKEATEGSAETGPFLAVANAAARRWWAAEGGVFEGFAYDSTSHVIVISEKMKEGMHGEFWAAFERAGQKLGQKLRTCPSLAKRLMLMEAEHIHDSANIPLCLPVSDVDEARRRGGFAPPDNWRAIIETAMDGRKAPEKTNRAAPGSGNAPGAEKVYHCLHCTRWFSTSQGLAGHTGGHNSRKDKTPARNESGTAARRDSAPAARGAPDGAPGGASGLRSNGRPEAAPEADGPRVGTRKRGRPEAAPAAERPGVGTRSSGRPQEAAPAAAAAVAQPNTPGSNYDHRPGLLAGAAILAKMLYPESDLGAIMMEANGYTAKANEVIDLERC